MIGCTFLKLDHLEIGDIHVGDGDQSQYVQMPVCKSAKLPHWFASGSLSALQMPQLHRLDLHAPVDQGGPHSTSTHYTGLRFLNSEGLQRVSLMLPNLELLEIRHSWPYSGLQEFISILSGPCKFGGLDSFGYGDHGMGTQGQVLPPYPNLKRLRLKLQPKFKPRRELGLEVSLLRELLQQWKLELSLRQEMFWKEDEVLKQMLIRAQVRVDKLEKILVPATERVGWRCLVKDWVHRREEELARERDMLLDLMQKLNLVSG
jgi:hypothetical protein